jgi:hypothetical protein
VRLLHQQLDVAFQSITKIDIYAGASVSLSCHFL